MLEVAGIDLLPPLAQFLAFALAGLALNIVPGADMTFVIAAAARGGRRDGVVAALGIGAGTLVHILAAVLGLSAILASSQAVFNLIKWIGAAYLLWIAISLLRSGSSADAGSTAPPVSGLRLLRAAMLVNILNPKVALFFLAFLPQFVDPAAASPLAQMLVLSGVFMAMTFAVFVAYGFLAHALRSTVIESPRVQAWLRRGFAAAFAGLGANLALSDR